MDVMDQIVNAALNTTASGGGAQFNYGDYVVFLDKVVAKNGNEGPLFIPEFYIDQATDIPIDGVMQKANAPGTTAGYVCKMLRKEAASNARAFVLACLGLPETGKDDPNLQAKINQAMRRMAQPDQPLRGLAFRLTTWKYTNKGRNVAANAGKSFARLNFVKLDGQNAATLAANRAKMDAAAAGKVQAQAAAVLAQPAPAPALTQINGQNAAAVLAQPAAPAPGGFAAQVAQLPTAYPPPPAPVAAPIAQPLLVQPAAPAQPQPAPAYPQVTGPAPGYADPFAGMF